MGRVGRSLLAVVGLWVAASCASNQENLKTEDKVKKEPAYEILSSSYSQETTWNGTHTITVYTTMRKTDTNGSETSRKETTYVINKNGVITSYTIKEP